MTHRRAALAIAALFVAACSTPAVSTPSPTAVDPPPATITASTPPSAQASSPRVVVGGDRPVTVQVPPSYDAGQPAPMLIYLHGYSGSGEQGDEYFGLGTRAVHEGFVYAAPDGTLDGDGNRFWNATEACCDFDSRGVDDVAYLAGVIADIQGALAIDPNRIAVAGWSNGAFMTYRLACERADLVAAIVTLAGATFADPADCTPSEPVSVAHIHGTADDTVAFDGGNIFGERTRAHPGAEETARTWATYDGCDATATPLEARIDLEATLTDGDDPAETSRDEWSGCDGGATVQLWTIPNGSHAPSMTSAFAESVLRFLAEHPKPEPVG